MRWFKHVVPAVLASLIGIKSASAVVYGLDVYSGNGTMNWPLIAGGGKDFAFVKATEGLGFTDTALSTNENNGTAAGLLIGAYDFARPDTNNPATEADYYISVMNSVGGFASGKLMPMLDFEHTGNTGATNPSAWVNAWCAEVLAKTGLQALVYTYPSFAKSYLNSTVVSHPLFIASYDHTDPASNPSVTGPWNGAYSFWQYTSTGRIAGGPSGNVDLDIYNGNLDALVANFAIGGVKPSVISVPEPTLAAAGLLFFGMIRRRSR